MDGREATRDKDAVTLEAAQDRRVARITCGWCNKVVGRSPDDTPKFVTCDECRGLLPSSERVA